MDTRITLALAFGLWLGTTHAPLHAQAGNPGAMTPTQPPARPGPPPTAEVNHVDRLFVLLAGSGGLAEVETARLAEERGAQPGVKQFARRMLQDHGRANARLAALARESGVTLPSEPTADQQAMRTRLQSLQGRAFDLAYLHGQLVEHQKTVQLLQYESGQGQHAALRRHAMALLPGVTEHLALVQGLLAEASGAPPAGLAAAWVPRSR